MSNERRIIERGDDEVNGSISFVDAVRRLQASGQRCIVVLALFIATMAGAAPGRAPGWAVVVMPNGEEYTLEIAADDAARARGYMERDRISDREGMLFIFPDEDYHAIWMKNCRVTLDVVWLDPAFRVVDIAPELRPCPADGPCPSSQPMEPARYVLELAGGTAGRLGIKRNVRLTVLMEPTRR